MSRPEPSGASVGPVWRDPARPPGERAAALLAELTIDEKLAQIGSAWLTDLAADFAPSVDGAAPSTGPGGWTDGLGQLTRVFGSAPVEVAEGVRRLRELQDEVIASSRFGIPAIAHEECLTGITAYRATIYPAPLAWASTFDEELVGRMAEAIGRDLHSLGIHQGLAPVVDVVRDYRWGRVEETLGEDPYLVGQLGAAYVAGLQRSGVIATLKHFAGYSASRGAKNHGPVSMGARELADVILPPYETAIRLGGARSVMNAYNDIDGVPAAADARLLTGMLREQWGFEGTVVADYWAIAFLVTMHRVAEDATTAGILALTAGIDVELPMTTSYGAGLAAAIRSGALDEALLDRAALRHLVHKLEAGLLDGTPPVPPGAEDTDLDSPENRAIAAAVAEESVVLLSNRSILPLRGPSRIAVVGPVADEARCLLGCYSFPNHVLASHPEHDLGVAVPTVLAAIRDEFPESEVNAVPGCSILDSDLVGLPVAIEAIEQAEVAIIVVGDLAGLFGRGTSGEGCDASDLRLPGGQHDLVMAALATGTPVVLVVVSGRPYALGDYESAGAIVQSFFPGEEGAAALAGILSGRVRPSGRLPVQIPRSVDQPFTYRQPPLGQAAPGISVMDPTPMFPFGFGLTSGRIEYYSLAAPDRIETGDAAEVEVTVCNTGEVDAVEVVQLYGSDPVAQVARPDVELLGFARIAVPAGASRTVRFELHTDRLSYTGPSGDRVVDPGEYRLSAGPSATSRPVSAVVDVTGPTKRIGHDRVLRTPWSIVE